MVNLDPAVWGPHYWFFLNTVAINYPLKPNDVTKKIYYNLISNFHLFIPVEEHGRFFNDLLETYPIATYLDDRESFTRWVHFIHNKVNDKLNYPRITYENFFIEYYNYYKNKIEMNFKYKKISKIILFALIVVILLFLINNF